MNTFDPKLAEFARIAADLDVLCGDDETLFADMMEGETDVHGYVQKLHNAIAANQELIIGAKARRDEISERIKRKETANVALKAAIGRVLRLCLLKKIELPEATYSVREGKANLEIVNPEAVPEAFQRVSYAPDKTAINEAFAEANDLPNWLVREPARDVVTARTK